MNSVIVVSSHVNPQHPVTVAQRPVTAVELVSSRSCVWLGSHLCAWTLLDILGLAYGVDHAIIMSPSFKSRLAPY